MPTEIQVHRTYVTEDSTGLYSSLKWRYTLHKPDYLGDPRLTAYHEVVTVTLADGYKVDADGAHICHELDTPKPCRVGALQKDGTWHEETTLISGGITLETALKQKVAVCEAPEFYNLQCMSHGYAGRVYPHHPLWQKCKDRDAAGFMDALCVNNEPEYCSQCAEEKRRTDALDAEFAAEYDGSEYGGVPVEEWEEFAVVSGLISQDELDAGREPLQDDQDRIEGVTE